MELLKDVLPGQIVVVQTGMDDGEVREIAYRREAGAGRHKNFVRVVRLSTVQGKPGQVPRYRSGPVLCRDPGEAHGLTPTHDAWDSKWPKHVIDAVSEEQKPQ